MIELHSSMYVVCKDNVNLFSFCEDKELKISLKIMKLVLERLHLFTLRQTETKIYISFVCGKC